MPPPSEARAAGSPAAVTIAWLGVDGSGGHVALGDDGHPRFEFTPAAATVGDDRRVEGRPDAFHFAVSVASGAASAADRLGAEARARYLDLMKKCLTRLVFKESGPPIDPGNAAFDPAARAEGRDWPADAETMAGMLRLDTVQHCVEDVLRRGIPGDLIETGVWRGGTTIFMRAILAAHGDATRQV